ncbi:DDB1- and CUL4-associated factor 5 [Microtus ochrogaster]|uniref:DDB1- and CUL4-associated factor 5 n=1 Tax=Microtus ochrogaster TaxID=79684 RepID=A0A8J6L4Z6_MICOH|nr:DDB1- and CUL4-associated factor 5 [Microtus ochrogaster]
MKRRAGLGGSMRSVVGFLSQRGLHGDPLLTQDFQRRRLRGCRNLYKKDLLGHFGCVNAIEFSNNGGQWLVSAYCSRGGPARAAAVAAPAYAAAGVAGRRPLLPGVAASSEGGWGWALAGEGAAPRTPTALRSA